MKTDILKKIKHSLKDAMQTPQHPFKFFTLGTVGLNGLIKLRTVVLRNVDDDLNFTIYTDKRTKKLTHIRENKSVSLLFYDPKEMIQVDITAEAIVENNDEKLDKLWQKIPEHSKKNYLTEKTPGSEITHPDKITYTGNHKNFIAIYFKPKRIEYLELTEPKNIRIRFDKSEFGWDSTFVVP
ncbi:pyridoxamine 5'-phosphate oxidase family protein [Zhouia sp. PK063]|uniref:pyridoxamine 5'-phosphate oxidase family protein n=1 Tax=Zhouia sp. PK063 TaxID=3373602 RepID=UPI0037A879C7